MAVGGVAPELAYVVAKFAALAPFARVAELLSELLPIGGAANPGKVRNRTMRVGRKVARCPLAEPTPSFNAVGSTVVVGLDGGYVRSRHRRAERNFDHALGAAAALGAKTPHAGLGKQSRRNIERAKWRLWHGRWKGCLVKLAEVRQWLGVPSISTVVGAGAVRGHLDDLLFYLEANQCALVNYAARRRRAEPISTAFVERAVNEVIAKRMIEKQQMRWNWWTVQPFFDVRVAVLNGTLERSFRQTYPSFRPANHAHPVSAAA